MSSISLAIASLVVAWALQGLGTYWQMRHFSTAMGEILRTWSDGFVGTGRARSRFGAGTVLLLVVDSDRIVRRLMVMRGLTVFARFSRRHDVEGLPLASLEAHPSLGGVEREALGIAAGQVDGAAARARRTDA